jgi:hypothetical protein
VTGVARSNDTVRDLVQVGAMFGLIAGIVAWVLVLLWTLLMQLRETKPSLRAVLVLHLEYVIVYVAIGVVIGVLWPTRSALAGRVVVNVLACAVGAMTIFSISAGPIWRWPMETWIRFATASVLFALISTTWTSRRGP